MPSFIIGLSGGDHLKVHAHCPANDEWVNVEVGVGAGGFVGGFGANFLVRDFVHLRSELQRLYDDLSGSMKFETLERQLEFEIIGNGRGHFDIYCLIEDRSSGVPCRMEFGFDFDQSYIPAILRDLDNIISQCTT